MEVIPIILSGGSGTRLWPVSRASYPKQFISFFNGRDSSLLAATLARLRQASGFAAPIVVCNNHHRFLVAGELEHAGVEAQDIILEPVARNTAPAVAVGALRALRTDPEAIIAVLPSDHLIRDDAGFLAAIGKAAEIAETGRLMLMGVRPDSPHTGYGYIRTGERIGDTDPEAFAISAFVEKPGEAKARKLIAEQDCYWNSGVFVMKAQTCLDELKRFEPDVLKAATAAMDQSWRDLCFLRLDSEAFASSPEISIDYAIGERTERGAILPIDVGWSDLGSWSSVWQAAPRDKDDNYVHGDAVLKDTRGCCIHSEKALVSTIGVKDLVIVDTPDALLVADRARSQDVSGLVAALRQSNRPEQERHIRNLRPWGYFETLNAGPRFQVKLLHVKPGGGLSLQMHRHRSEHWVVVQGTAKVTIGDTETLLTENESVYILATQWHRLENPGTLPLQIIEVQLGTYLGEDDIVRAEDGDRRAPGETG